MKLKKRKITDLDGIVKREEIYDLYWYFAFERQNIFNKKKNGLKPPWTEDEILAEYKFCNSYRVNDRVSQYLLKNVIYNGKEYSSENTIFRIVLFKLFNKESTWEYLEKEFGEVILESFSFETYSGFLTELMQKGVKIYSDAYMSCATKAFGYDRKHENHLSLLNKMFLEDKISEKLLKSKNMEEAFNILVQYPLIGDFMAYQIITDINYSDKVNWSEAEFTVVGPGSKRGISKCFLSIGKNSEKDIIKYMYENQEKEFKRLGYNFKGIKGRKLQLIDCQNIFCELDKYCRKSHPALKSNRIKIKKKYIPKKEKIEYIYPPKWNI